MDIICVKPTLSIINQPDLKKFVLNFMGILFNNNNELQ